MGNESLSRKIVRGGIWIFALRIISRCLGFIRTMILARLLSPHDFGLLGIAMLSVSVLETFSQTGFQAALIQKQENVESCLDTAWTVSAVRGLVLSLLLLFSASFIADFFRQPDALPIIQIMAISPLMTGFRNIGLLFFQKELAFDRQFTYELAGTVSDIAVSIILAFMLRNVWALVWGGVAGNTVRLGMSYWLHPYRPRIRFDWERFQEMLKFGRWVSGSGILIFIITQGDDIFVGKILGTASLGLYQMAYMISNLPTTEITHGISQLTFPAYSKLMNEPGKFREAYLKVLRLTAFITFPLAAGIAILARDFVILFYGEKWSAMIPAMQIMAVAGMIRSLAATAGPVFYSAGKPYMDTFLQLIRLAVLVLFIWPLSMKWGISGTSLAVCLSIGISTIGFSGGAVHVSQCGFSNFAGNILIPLAGTLAMVNVLLFASDSFSSVGIFPFFLQVFLGITAYLLMMSVLDKYTGYGLLFKNKGKS